MIGYYSEKAVEAGCGTSIYWTPDGQKVEVTAVFPPSIAEVAYDWDDKKCLGEVTDWAGPGRPWK
jgi:hypothetical protein